MPKSQLASEIGHPLVLSPPRDASEAMRLPYLRLAAAVTYQAIQDVRHERDAVALDALMWLCLAEPPRWTLELLEFEAETPAILFSRGLGNNVPVRQPGRKKGKKLTE